MTLTAEVARKTFIYDPEEGVLRWATGRRGGVRAGDVAGSLTNGARQFEFNGRSYLAHRVVWLMMTGEWPKQLVDHKNGIRDDNRWVNLRDVSRTVNNQNLKGANDNNKSGLLGASYASHNGRWRSQITIDGEKWHLGYFDTAEEAHEQYLCYKRWWHDGCEI